MSSSNTNLPMPSIEPDPSNSSLSTLYEQAKVKIDYYEDLVRELEEEKWEANKRADDLEEANETLSKRADDLEEANETLSKEAEAAAEAMILMDQAIILKDRMLKDSDQIIDEKDGTIAELRAQLVAAGTTTTPATTITPVITITRRKTARPRRQLNPNRIIKKRAPRAFAVTPQPELERSNRRARFTGNYKI